jgi:hypothetical protein
MRLQQGQVALVGAEWIIHGALLLEE